jgi:hypothetical protein
LDNRIDYSDLLVIDKEKRGSLQSLLGRDMGFLDWFRRLRKQGRARIEPFIVVSVIVSGGVSADDGCRLRELLNTVKALDWWFLNPGSFQVFFRSDVSGRAQSAEFVTQLSALKTSVPSHSGLRIGTAEGPLVASYKADGSLEFPPMGETSNRALRTAHGLTPEVWE